VRWPLWLLAGVLVTAATVTELLEDSASRTAAVAGDGARTLEGLAVEVVAVRSVLATGVTRERRSRAAASLRYQTLDGGHPYAQWARDAARLIDEAPGFGRARVLDPAERTTRDDVGAGR
jgi:chloramphenicol 3-O-phosphotransferase